MFDRPDSHPKPDLIDAAGVFMHYAVGARQVAVLRGVDLRIAAGTRVALSGPTGLGKTSAVLHWRLEMSPGGLYWTGGLTALAVSALSLSLGLGARYLLSQMRPSPALLLRSRG